MLKKESLQLVGMWLFASTLAVLSCSLYLSAAHFHGEYLPVGNDSFYHARRILDAVNDLTGFYQFDPKIHAPEGSLLVWPWGYDYLIAVLVRVALALHLSADPMQILVWIPVACVTISTALIIALARTLSVGMPATFLASVCFALAPTTQFLHGAGQIDHHYAEMMFVLGALICDIRWFQQPTSQKHAVLLGLVLGLAPSIHNGLFVLQVPFIVATAVRWLNGHHFSLRSGVTFAAALLASTVAILIPSLPFRMGLFEFYTLSWFHLYIATCTAGFVFLFIWIRPSKGSFALILAIAAALLLPLIAQVRMAQSFVTGSFRWLEAIAEMKSPLREAFKPEGARILTQIYSALAWLAPVTLALCLFRAWKERNSARLVFWMAAAMGLLLLFAQIRLHYFGDFALYFPWLVVVNDVAAKRHEHAKSIWLACGLALVLLYAPVLRHQIVAPISTANDRTFEDTRPLFSALQKACAEDPGVVLADNNAGHYVRYYSSCSVLIDNFLLTPQHFRKMDEAERLFSMSARELANAAPYIKYVLVRPLDIRRGSDPQGGYKYWFFFPGTPQLAQDLLFSPVDRVPAEFKLIYEIRFAQADNVPYARLFKIERPGDSISERR